MKLESVLFFIDKLIIDAIIVFFLNVYFRYVLVLNQCISVYV